MQWAAAAAAKPTRPGRQPGRVPAEKSPSVRSWRRRIPLARSHPLRILFPSHTRALSHTFVGTCDSQREAGRYTTIRRAPLPLPFPSHSVQVAVVVPQPEGDGKERAERRVTSSRGKKEEKGRVPSACTKIFPPTKAAGRTSTRWGWLARVSFTLVAPLCVCRPSLSLCPARSWPRPLGRIRRGKGGAAARRPQASYF